MTLHLHNPESFYPTACGIPFRTVEEAWFWTMRQAIALAEPPRMGAARDVIACLHALYRRHRIDLQHARVLRIWGERQTAPDPTNATERADWRLWCEAMQRLEWALRVKGIVSGAAPVVCVEFEPQGVTGAVAR
jgi:hypothetical protein